jgi:hypothetical protein
LDARALLPRFADSSSFGRWFAACLAACAALISGWTSLQFSLELGAARSLEPLWKSLVCTSAPAASGTALAVALVLWASRRRPAELRAELGRALARGAAVALPGYFAAAASSLVVGVAVVSVSRGMPGSPTVALPWLGVGAVATAVDSGLVLGLAFRFLPRLHGARLSLPGALSVVLAVTVPVRATAGLVVSSLLSR